MSRDGRRVAGRNGVCGPRSNESRLAWLLRTSPLRRVKLRVALLVIVLFGLGWRTLRYGLAFPIWGDEAFVAVNFLERGYAGMIDPLLYGQIVPLAFMWVELAVSRALGLSEWALRLVPFLAGVAALLLFWKLAADILPLRPRLLAVGIFAASVYLVRHGAELKPYATDLLFAILYLLAGLRVLRIDIGARPADAGVGRYIALIALALIGPWCSYPSVFVGGGIWLALAWELFRRKRDWRIKREASGGGRSTSSMPSLIGLGTFGVALIGSFVAMYALYGGPHAQAASRLTEIQMWTETFPPLREPGKLLVWLAAIHTGTMFAYPAGGTAPGSIVTFALFVWGAFALGRKNGPLLLMLLGPLPLVFIAAAMHKYPYGGTVRTSIYLAPAICLLAGLGADRAIRGLVGTSGVLWGLTKLGRNTPAFARRHGYVVAVGAVWAVLLIVCIGGAIRDIRNPEKDESVRASHDAVRTVARQVRPGDRWVMFNAKDEVPWAPNLADWQGTGAQFVFDSLRFSPVPVEWSPDPRTIGCPAAGHLWLLAYRGVRKEFPQAQLDAYVEAVAARCGTPQQTWHLIKTKIEEEAPNPVEGFDVFRFGP